MEFTKDKIGQTIYGLGTGNNAPRSGGNNIVEFELVSIGRVYVELKQKGFRFTDKYKPESGITQSSARGGYRGGGYRFFDSLDDLNKYVALEGAKGELRRKMSCIRSYHISDLSEELVYKLLEMLKEIDV